MTLAVESVDRLYLNLYRPRLQYVNGVCGSSASSAATFASSALMNSISRSSSRRSAILWRPRRADDRSGARGSRTGACSVTRHASAQRKSVHGLPSEPVDLASSRI